MLVFSSDGEKMLYKSIISVLSDIKLSTGPESIPNYLFWRKPIQKFLIKKQKLLLDSYGALLDPDGTVKLDVDFSELSDLTFFNPTVNINLGDLIANSEK